MPRQLLSLFLLGTCLAVLPPNASANGDGVGETDVQNVEAQDADAPEAVTEEVEAQEADVQSAAALRGHQLVQEKCAECHSIDKTGASRFPAAPALRELKDRYPLEGLEEAFAEGIVVGHPAMPEYQFDPDQIADLIAYLEWLGD